MGWIYSARWVPQGPNHAEHLAQRVTTVARTIRSYAVSEGLLLGKTELTIEYTDYRVTVR
jgi:hypothetical protein